MLKQQAGARRRFILKSSRSSQMQIDARLMKARQLAASLSRDTPRLLDLVKEPFDQVPAFPKLPQNRTCCGHAKIDKNDASGH
jgi:hypothetical protein